jgi:hypothetical protein
MWSYVAAAHAKPIQQQQPFYCSDRLEQNRLMQMTLVVTGQSVSNKKKMHACMLSCGANDADDASGNCSVMYGGSENSMYNSIRKQHGTMAVR